ncbi:MAG: hypothetical protein ACI8W7_002078, partial [Gammaproteobacteria bacterium]
MYGIAQAAALKRILATLPAPFRNNNARRAICLRMKSRQNNAASVVDASSAPTGRDTWMYS